MNRRDTVHALPALAASVLGLVAAPGLAQKQAQTPRVGILVLAALPSIAAIIDGMRSSLRDLGYVEGSSIHFDILSAEGNAERLPELAAQLVARKVDIIITGGGNVSALAAHKATSTIPIIMTSSTGPVEAGLVQSLARPGGNVTGFTVPLELGFKQLQLLQEVVPPMPRAVILLRHDPAQAAAREQAKVYAQMLLAVTLDLVEVRSPEDMTRALEAVRAAKPNAMVVSPDPLLYQQREQILRFTRAARIPDMYSYPDIVDDGGLMAYTGTAQEILAGISRFVDRLLKGAKPADLPVEQLTRFDLVINMKTATSLGLKVPQSLLLRAERVIT